MTRRLGLVRSVQPLADLVAGRPPPGPEASRDERYELPALEYDLRCNAVYWRRVECCGSKGPHGAKCVRYPDHAGIHEGNADPDGYGPKYWRWD